MFRNLLATTAIAALLTTAAHAQETMTPAPARPAPTEGVTQAAPVERADGHLASAIIGETVYNGSESDAQNIGKVNDLVIAPNGTVDAIVIGVGGFLGIGEKYVAVAYSDASWAAKDGDQWLVVNTSKEQLEALPEFDRRAYEAAPATSSVSQAPAADPTTVDPTTTAAYDKSRLTKVPVGEIRSTDLTGTTVYGAEDAKVGEIGDVVLSGDGKVDAVVIDVGGFLGIGEKEVAVGMDNLAFMADKDGKKYLYTDFTKDQLEAQPAYDKSTYTQKRDEQRMIIVE